MENILQDEVAIVTGGTAGIGKSIAKKYVEQGAKVAVFGRNAERGKQLEDEIGENAVFFQVDVKTRSPR